MGPGLIAYQAFNTRSATVAAGTATVKVTGTVSPYGGVILAEDGEGIQHLVGVTDQGKAYPLARNEEGTGEFTGPTFSADGKTLFACIQMPGYVFAITGPWRRPSNAKP